MATHQNMMKLLSKYSHNNICWNIIILLLLYIRAFEKAASEAEPKSGSGSVDPKVGEIATPKSESHSQASEKTPTKDLSPPENGVSRKLKL